MIKTIFFDVDGTLVSHTQRALPASAKRSLERLKEKGIRREVATGRHRMELPELPVRGISFDGYITLNGQLCFDGEGRLIASSPITGADKEHLLQLFVQKELPILLVEKDDMYINFINPWVEAAQKAISTGLPRVGRYTGGEVYQVVAYLGRGREEELSPLLPGCKITRWNEYGVDIISSQGGKAWGIQQYLAFTGLKREETAAFGDGENDMDMLEFVEMGIAMGNGEEQVKRRANLVTASVDEDGIEKALVQLGLME